MGSSRVLTITALDGEARISNSVTSTINVGNNNVPTITLSSSSGTFTEGSSNLDIGGSVSLADAETPDAYNSVQISVTTAEILDGSSEKLVINRASSGGTIDLNFSDGDSISDVVLSGVTYSVTASVTGGESTLTFAKDGGGTLTDAQAEALLSALEYKNTSDNPSTSGNRVFDLGVTDSNSSPATSTLASFTASVAGTNDAPTITLSSSSGTFTEGGSNLDIGGTVTVADSETPDAYNSVQLSVTTAEILDGSSEKLVINSASSGGSIDLNFSNGASISNVVLSGVTYSVTASVASGESTLTFAKNGGGTLSDSEAEALLSSLEYQNTSEAPTTSGTRVFDLGVTDSNASPAHKHSRLLHHHRRCRQRRSHHHPGLLLRHLHRKRLEPRYRRHCHRR